jgi:hypothetical protein
MSLAAVTSVLTPPGDGLGFGIRTEAMKMKKMRNSQLGLCVVVLAATSCGFPPLSALTGGGPGSDAATGNGSDAATGNGGALPLSLELLAGDIGPHLGSDDGTGAAARFNGPAGVAVDSAGNVYVADLNNDTIRKMTTAGVVTTLAGTAIVAGSADGTGAAARFNGPSSVAVDGAGNVYVADQNNHTIRKVTPAGVVATLAGTAGIPGSADGTGAAAGFYGPLGVAVDSANNIYVVDNLNHTVRKVTAAGVVTTLAGTTGMPGSADGIGAAARFNEPVAVAVDGAGNVYVADYRDSTIRKVTAAGVVTTLAGTAGMAGNADGTGAMARFWFPAGVAVDSAGNVYVADSNNSTIRKISPTGATTTIAGIPGDDGIVLGARPRFAAPLGLAIINDSIVVSDTNAVLLLRHGAQ